jgi:hypothetical protein
LEDDVCNNVKGLITIVTEFFTAHRHASIISDVHINDFVKLLRMLLFEDTYCLAGKLYLQTQGIAMGNCAAPALAIIYMHYIERHICNICPDIVFWKRYINDIFFVAKVQPSVILNKANECNSYIKFTLELPTNNILPFLDTSVHKVNLHFEFDLYIKSTHSGTCLPFNSFVPLSRKKCLIISEYNRVKRNTSVSNFNTAWNKINSIFLANGYPQLFIDKTIKSMSTTNKPKSDYVSFIKVPYLSEQQLFAIKRLLRTTGMSDKIRLIFTTERNLGWSFRPKREYVNCRDPCVACTTAIKPNQCYIKFAVYKIECNLCNAIYIGQTIRTMRSRINEHCTDKKSFVYVHMLSHGNNNNNKFKWSILSTNRSRSARLVMESLFIIFIKTFNNFLMNGCEETQILPFLKQ